MWLGDPIRSFHHGEFLAEELAVRRTQSVSVCIPARDEEDNIAPTVEIALGLVERHVIDEVVVIDDRSSDATADRAAAAGATVISSEEVLQRFGPSLGKGDAMWRACAAVSSDVVCFVDADSQDFGAHFLTGLLGPVLTGESAFVKGTYRRPFANAGQRAPTGGGRVTELTARPLLRLFYPPLAEFGQPLAGEVAALRSLLVDLPFEAGYGVDVGLLIDSYRRLGADRLAQTDLDVRSNTHQALESLARMSLDVSAAMIRRLVQEGRVALDPTITAALEARPLRPPLSEELHRPPLSLAQR